MIKNATSAGKCKTCEARFDVGARINLEKDESGKWYVQSCPACVGGTEETRGARREADANLAHLVPRNTREIVMRCGTLAQALPMLSSVKSMAEGLASTGRTVNELFLAATNACLNSSALTRCEPMSWVNALQAAAALGIVPDPGMSAAALAYFIPRGGKVSLDLSYRGLATLAFNSGFIEQITGEVIWECEALLGTVAGLLNSDNPRRVRAGERMVEQLRAAPPEHLSDWDKAVIKQALDAPDGLAVDWFFYRETPFELRHERPYWFKPPDWHEYAPLPWGVYADVALRGGGRGSTVLLRETAYERAVRGRNAVLKEVKGVMRLMPGSSYGKWATTPWCLDQIEMLKKTALRDVLTGGRVPMAPRLQRAVQSALAAEVIDGEAEVVQLSTLDQHLRQVAAPPKEIEQQEYVEEEPPVPEDAHAYAENGSDDEGFVRDRLATMSAASMQHLLAQKKIPVVFKWEELTPAQRDYLLSELA